MKTILALVMLLSVSAFAQSVRGTPPSYCHPCLFYGGDFDAANPLANFLPNAIYPPHSEQGHESIVYVPFFVPPGQTWTVTGLFSNNLSNSTFLDPPRTQWSISSGISAGNHGTVIAAGTLPATWTATGRSFVGMLEYTALGHLTPTTAVTLTTGVYWMTAVPVCTNSSDCGTFSSDITDVEDIPAPNHKGVQPNDDSYFLWPNGKYFFAPTWGDTGACGNGNGGGCDKFSSGLLGYAKPTN